MQQDYGTQLMLLHPSCDSGTPPVLPLLSSALRAYIDAAAAAAAAAAGPASLQQQDAAPSPRLSKFHAVTAPRIQVEAYLQRLFKYTKCSPVCLVMAFAYMKRLGAVDPSLRVSHFNVHRLLIAGTMLACKFTDDRYFTNHYYAQVGGVALAELNGLELELLARLDYRAHVDVPELCACLQHIQGAAAGGAAWVAMQLQPEGCGAMPAPGAALAPSAPPAQQQQEQEHCLGLALSEWARAKQPAAAEAEQGGEAGGGSSPGMLDAGRPQEARACEVAAASRASLAVLGCKQERCGAASMEGMTIQAA